MFRTCKYFTKLYTPFISVSDSFFSVVKCNWKCNLPSVSYNLSEIKHFKTRPRPNRDPNKKFDFELEDEASSLDEKPEVLTKSTGILPDETTANTVYDGVPYKFLPILNIRVSQNNVILNLTDHKGVVKAIRSAGSEGFRNIKKGTPIAAQTTAISFSAILLEMGYKVVRLRIRGVGPGRVSTVKGIVMGGLNVVSVTDNTRYTDNPSRAKKMKR